MEKSRAVKLSLSNNLLSLNVNSHDLGDASEELEINYEYDNLGTACKYFDYNPTTSTCKCAGPGPVLGATESATGTTAYVLDETCGRYECFRKKIFSAQTHFKRSQPHKHPQLVCLEEVCFN